VNGIKTVAADRPGLPLTRTGLSPAHCRLPTRTLV